MMPVDLLTVGEAFEDLIFHGLERLPEQGEEMKTHRFMRTVGGGAVITAIAAARLGVRCGIVSGLNQAAAKLLRREHVTVKNLQRKGEDHAVSVALSTPDNRTFVTYQGANPALEERILALVPTLRARHVHFALAPSDCTRWRRGIETIRRYATTTSWDFGWNPSLRRDAAFSDLVGALDYLFVNEKEALYYAGSSGLEVALSYWRKRSRNTIVKRGSYGAHWIAASGDRYAPAQPVTVVDTTGAGDAFNGGFLCAVLRGRPSDECLRSGNRVGRMSTRAVGGIDGLPVRRGGR